MVELKTEGAQALVTESGGATSHGVLLARAMGIPVVTGIADMLPSMRPGDRLIVDGTSGVAEGIGLYRTEFPFIVRDSFSTGAEQVRIYGKAYELFPAGPIHFRLLDLGGDKFVAGGHVATARSALHGYRSIRVRKRRWPSQTVMRVAAPVTLEAWLQRALRMEPSRAEKIGQDLDLLRRVHAARP